MVSREPTWTTAAKIHAPPHQMNGLLHTRDERAPPHQR